MRNRCKPPGDVLMTIPRQCFCCGLFQLSLVMRNLFMAYANNNGTDQPVHPRSLISAYVIRCLDSIILLVSISEI